MAGVDTRSRIEGNELVYFVSTTEKQKSKRVAFDTEKELHIESKDLNFDGHHDLSAWHIDDGMGSFTVHRIFIFSPMDKDFTEHFPACADQFLNLRPDHVRKILVSTYFEENIAKLCETSP